MEEDPTLKTLILILALVLLNSFFAAAEMALVSVRHTRIRQLVEEGSARARTVQRLLDRPTSYIATIQIGVTLVGFLASAVAAINLAQPVAGLIDNTPIRIISENATGLAVFSNSICRVHHAYRRRDLSKKSGYATLGEDRALDCRNCNTLGVCSTTGCQGNLLF